MNLAKKGLIVFCAVLGKNSANWNKKIGCSRPKNDIAMYIINKKLDGFI